MDKLQAMQAFLRVVESGTFVKAAESMQLPKPTVTRLIQSLEEHLSVRLLNRTTRRVSVTSEGAAYYDRASRLLGEIDELEASVTAARSAPKGRLKIDLPGSLGVGVIVPALPDFRARYPDIDLEIGVGDRSVDLIGDNIDCVVRGGEVRDQSLIARRVGDVHLVGCATPGYLGVQGVPRHPDDLRIGHTLIRAVQVPSGRLYPFTLRKGEEVVQAEGARSISFNDTNAAVAGLKAGLGIGCAPSFLVQQAIGEGVLELVLPDWQAPSVPIHVVYPPNRHLSAKVRVFVDWIVELFAAHDLLQRKSTLPGRPVTDDPLAASAAKAPQDTAAVALS
jgi:LysR family transcriptional regulator for bpeEF and oprC